MTPFSFIVLALAPGLFWLWFYVRKNSYRPEPRRLLAITFGLGMLSTLPAGIIEQVFIGDSLDDTHITLGAVALNMLFIVGPVEEVSKFLAVRLYAYRSGYFEEPMDGLVYSAAASLGFASLENFVYILGYGPEVMLARGPLSTLAHLVFGSFWGYALGWSRGRGGGSFVVVIGLAAAAAVHGFFNVSVFSGGGIALGIAMVIAGAFWAMSRFNWARRVSPFRYRSNYPLAKCTNCQRPFRVTLPACPYCGTALMRREASLVCGNCKAANRPDAAFCTTCGDRFVG
ncbi:MAG: putative protease [Dehalococcoidia bacterium]|nr:putative protease [Dehalococcoidia bacterium]